MLPMIPILDLEVGDLPDGLPVWYQYGERGLYRDRYDAWAEGILSAVCDNTGVRLRIGEHPKTFPVGVRKSSRRQYEMARLESDDVLLRLARRTSVTLTERVRFVEKFRFSVRDLAWMTAGEFDVLDCFPPRGAEELSMHEIVAVDDMFAAFGPRRRELEMLFLLLTLYDVERPDWFWGSVRHENLLRWLSLMEWSDRLRMYVRMALHRESGDYTSCLLAPDRLIRFSDSFGFLSAAA
jgi:hypothetical protein